MYDKIESLEPNTAVALLSGMVGRHVKVEINLFESFLGGGFQGPLRRVDSLPAPSTAIMVAVGEGDGVFLDPADCDAYRAHLDGRTWIEFHSRSGPVISVSEPAAIARSPYESLVVSDRRS